MNVVMARTGRKYGLRVAVFLGLVLLVVVAPYLPRPPDPEHVNAVLGVGVALILGDTLRPMGTVTSRLPAAASALVDAMTARSAQAGVVVTQAPAAPPPAPVSRPGAADAYPPRPTVAPRAAPSPLDGFSEADLLAAARRARTRREGEGEAG